LAANLLIAVLVDGTCQRKHGDREQGHMEAVAGGVVAIENRPERIGMNKRSTGRYHAERQPCHQRPFTKREPA
jgi:hypothetical protein